MITIELIPTLVLGSIATVVGIIALRELLNSPQEKRNSQVLSALIIGFALLAIASVWQYEKYERYGRQRTVERTNIENMKPTVLQVQGLVQQGREVEARQITQSMSKSEYELYKKTKEELGFVY